MLKIVITSNAFKCNALWGSIQCVMLYTAFWQMYLNTVPSIHTTYHRNCKVVLYRE